MDKFKIIITETPETITATINYDEAVTVGSVSFNRSDSKYTLNMQSGVVLTPRQMGKIGHAIHAAFKRVNQVVQGITE